MVEFFSGNRNSIWGSSLCTPRHDMFFSNRSSPAITSSADYKGLDATIARDRTTGASAARPPKALSTS